MSTNLGITIHGGQSFSENAIKFSQTYVCMISQDFSKTESSLVQVTKFEYV